MTKDKVINDYSIIFSTDQTKFKSWQEVDSNQHPVDY